MDKEEVKEKLESLAKLEGDGAILPQVLLELIEANEKAQIRLDDISTKIQNLQEDMKTETKNIDEKLGNTYNKLNKDIEKTAADTASSLGKKIIWCFVGIAVLIIVATLAVVKYIV